MERAKLPIKYNAYCGHVCVLVHDNVSICSVTLRNNLAFLSLKNELPTCTSEKSPDSLTDSQSPAYLLIVTGHQAREELKAGDTANANVLRDMAVVKKLEKSLLVLQ